ncbi:MAG TPA: hypothetical protein VFN13_09540, partial [Rudaea sp.]|nr:hypothetical protein [Rudaea sp.]
MCRFFVRLLCAGLFSANVFALPVASTTPVPTALKDWSGWVLNGLEYRACPFIATKSPDGPNDFFCAWPGRLSIDAGEDGADFSIAWQVQSPSWIA